MARTDPQVNIRLPAALIATLERAAADNNRSFKGEIEFRLAGWDDLKGDLLLTQKVLEEFRLNQSAEDRLVADERKATRLRVQSLENELQKARHEANVASAFRDDMAYMSNMLRQMHEEDRAKLKELEDLAYFLEADRVRLEARVNEETVVPRTNDGPWPLMSRLAQRIAWAVDQRMALMARLVGKIGPMEPVQRRANVAMYDAGIPSSARELAEIYVDEGTGEASAFHDYILTMIDGMPEDRQADYRRGLWEVMPRLFPDWKDDQHSLLD